MRDISIEKWAVTVILIFVSCVSLFGQNTQQVIQTGLEKLQVAISESDDPQEIRELKELRRQIRTMPKTFRIRPPTFASCPGYVGEFTQLNRLEIVGIDLKTIPPEVSKLKNLDSLHVIRCGLTSLGPEIAELDNVRDLMVFQNKLTTIPAEVGEMKSLEQILATRNSISTIPKELANLADLLHLDLSSNPIGDSEVAKICSLKNLALLDLRRTKISRSGIEKIIRALPNAEIWHSYETENDD